MRFYLPILLFLCFVSSAQAATLYIDPSTANLNRGDAVKVAVRLDTDEAAGECVNAIDAVISYSENITPVDISTGKSIFPIWVEAPVINKEKHTITFAGGIPNGYCGRVQGDPNLTNVLVELIFRAPGLQIGGGKDISTATVNFTDQTTAYLNDGKGTKATLTTLGTQLNLSDKIGNEIVDPWTGDVRSDRELPEEFSISLERDDKTFGGKYYIVFNTTDKQTGLSHYEVIEETTKQANLFDFGASNIPWETTRSPYVLKDQTLSSVIRVKAVDKAGNEYIATLQPDDSLRPKQLITLNQIVYLSIAGVALIMLFSILLVIRFIKKRKRNTDTSLSSEVGEPEDEDEDENELNIKIKNKLAEVKNDYE